MDYLYLNELEFSKYPNDFDASPLSPNGMCGTVLADGCSGRFAFIKRTDSEFKLTMGGDGTIFVEITIQPLLSPDLVRSIVYGALDSWCNPNL